MSTGPSLIPRLSWEGKESLVTTACACACAKISVFYLCAIRGLLDHMTIYYYASQARKLLRHNRTVIRRARNQRMLELPSRHHLHLPLLFLTGLWDNFHLGWLVVLAWSLPPYLLYGVVAIYQLMSKLNPNFLSLSSFSHNSGMTSEDTCT